MFANNVQSEQFKYFMISNVSVWSFKNSRLAACKSSFSGMFGPLEFGKMQSYNLMKFSFYK